MKVYDLLVISVEPFPYGKAATNRMISYLLGVASEKRVLYLCLSGPQYNSDIVLKQKGNYHGVDYLYMGQPVVSSRPNLLKRFFNILYRYLRTYFLLLFVFKYKSILLYSANHNFTNIIYSIALIRKSFIFRDVTELVGDKYSRSEKELFRMKKQMGRFSGLIVISKGIYDYFDNLEPSKKYLLPVLVDLNNFIVSEHKDKYFFYCSGANLERDGLFDTLNGFLLFNKKNPGFVLEIATSLNLKDAYHAKCKLIMDNHSDCIHYLGALPSYDIPRKLAKATALFVTPHKNYETKGFPTKLGEFLASGTPTICSSIDDLMEVLDNNTAYLVKPNSPYEIATALEKIVNNPDEAKQVGLSGRKLMIDKYTINAYKNELVDFLNLN